MRCSGCGKDIPFNGEVCPFCQRDKSGDKLATACFTICGFIGGIIGYAIADFWGAIIGAIVFGVIGMIMTLPQALEKAKKPPMVAVENQASRAVQPNPERTCPDCAETIKAAARVCRHCGLRFDAPTENSGSLDDGAKV